MARTPRKDDITVEGYMIFEDGRTASMDQVSPEELERFRDAAARRASTALSAYYSQHPEEYERLPSLE